MPRTRLLVVIMSAVLAAGLTVTPAAAVAPPCVGAWTSDEPTDIAARFEQVDVAPDGTVVVVGRAESSTPVFRRHPDGTWEELPPLPLWAYDLQQGSVIASSPDDITVVTSTYDRTLQAPRAVVWRFDGSGWSEMPGLPVQRWNLDEVEHRGDDLILAGTFKEGPDDSMTPGLLLREDGVWSRPPMELEPPAPGYFVNRLNGVAVGGGSRIWLVGQWDHEVRNGRGFLAVRGANGAWKQPRIPELTYTGDIDLANGQMVVIGTRKESIPMASAFIGRPGDWHEEPIPQGTGGHAIMRGPADIWLSSTYARHVGHIDAGGATMLPARARPVSWATPLAIAASPDGSIWMVGYRGRLADPQAVVQHICPWPLTQGELEPRVLRTTAPSTGVVWQVPLEATGPHVLVDTSPFDLFAQILNPGEVLSVTYPGAGRYRFRDVATGRYGVVSVAMIAHHIRTSPESIRLILGNIDAMLAGRYTAQVQVQGPADTDFRDPGGPTIDGPVDYWAYDQGPGTYRFRARMIAADGSLGPWSSVTSVTVEG